MIPGGRYVPLVTPFTDDGSTVSEVRLARLLRFYLNAGIRGFVVCSDVGEFFNLSTGERKMVLETVFRELRGDHPVLVHATRMGTSSALDLAQHASRHGARAVVIMPPYYGRFRDEEIENHFRVIANHAGIPVVAIDRKGKTAGVRDKLSQNIGIRFGSELLERTLPEAVRFRSDNFRIEETQVSLLEAIQPDEAKQGALRQPAFADLTAEFSMVAIAKAALEIHGIETGPARAPIHPVGMEAFRKLESLVR